MSTRSGQPDRGKSKEQLLAELRLLRARVAELQGGRPTQSGQAIDSDDAEPRARLAAIIESSDDAIISKDLNGIIKTWNAGAERILGYKSEEVVGRSITILIPPERLDEEREILSRLRRGQRIEHFQTIRVTKTGRRLEVSLTTSPVKDPTGRIIGASKILRDITDQKAMERELRATKEAAEAANQAKDRFLATMSHELRTPLTPVLATVAHLEAEPNLPASLRPDLTLIRRNVEQEARLIDDLLDLTRIRRGELKLHFEVVDAEGLIQACLAMYAPQIQDKRLMATLELAAPRRFVWADPPRLQQVICHLLSNAAKFTPDAGTITIRTSNDGDDLVIEVIDNGIGIEPSILPTVFDAFEQGEKSIAQQFGGLGLGLAIARAVVEKHGGTLTAASHGKGQGATFTVRLKAVSESAAQLQQSHEPTSSHLKRILLVEDHKDTLTIMARLLRSFGYGVTTASSVGEAIQLAKHESFDILLSDIGLPDGSGLDLARHVKRHRAAKTAIAMTGFGLDEDVARSREAGFQAHLTKPVNVNMLRCVLRKMS